MPGEDLLRFVGGPPPYPAVWLLVAIAAVTAVIAWWTAVLLWTAPPARLRRIPLVRDVHLRVTRRRFARSAREVVDGHRRGAVSRTDAGAGLGRVVRSFLAVRTGAPVQYLRTGEIADGDLAPAAAVLRQIDDVRFNVDSALDVAEVGEAAERLILGWDQRRIVATMPAR